MRSAPDQPIASTPEPPAEPDLAGRGGNPFSLEASAATVTRNFASLLCGRFGSQALTFLTNAYLARRIAPSGFGAVGLAQSVLSYLTLFADSGLSIIAVREGAQNRSRIGALIRCITGLRLALSCVLLPIGLLAAGYLPFSQASREVLRVFAFSLPFQALAVDWVFRALQRMQYAAATQLATAALTLLLTVSFVRSPQDLIRVPWLGLCATMGALALSVRLLARTGHTLSIQFRFRESGRYLARAFPLCASNLAVTLYIQANFLILGKVHGDIEVGMYAAASKVAGVFFILIWLYYAAISPALMELYAHSRQDAATMLAESVRLTAAAGCGFAAVGAIGSREILQTVFGPAFSPAEPALAVLLCSGGLVATTHNWGQLAIAAHRERLVLSATALGAAVNILVSVFLIGSLGSLGAAIGNLLAEIAVGAALIVPWPGRIGIGALRGAAGPAAVAVLAILAGLYLLRWGSLEACCGVAAIYAAGLLLTGSITRRDLNRLSGVLRLSLPLRHEPIRIR